MRRIGFVVGHGGWQLLDSVYTVARAAVDRHGGW